MPKYPRGTQRFTVNIQTLERHDGAKRYRVELPKQLMDRLGSGVSEITGRFRLDERFLVLQEKARVVTAEHLCDKWWDTHVPNERRDEIRFMDWDDLLVTIGVECNNCAGRDIRIGDFDETTYETGTVWVTFNEHCPKCGSAAISGDHITRGVGFDTDRDQYYCEDCGHNWSVDVPKT